MLLFSGSAGQIGGLQASEIRSGQSASRGAERAGWHGVHAGAARQLPVAQVLVTLHLVAHVFVQTLSHCLVTQFGLVAIVVAAVATALRLHLSLRRRGVADLSTRAESAGLAADSLQKRALAMQAGAIRHMT